MGDFSVFEIVHWLDGNYLRVSVHLFRQLLDCSKYEVEIISDAMLTAEVVGHIRESSSRLLCIVALPPGGLGKTRYLCKRLRARFPELKIAVGRWGTEGDDRSDLLRAGADKVGTTMIETVEQIIQLCQMSDQSDAQSVTIAPVSSSAEKTFLPTQKMTEELA